MRRLFILFLLYTSGVQAQNKDYAKNIIKQLTSDEMEGRGYVKGGCEIAANFIAKELHSAGVTAFNNDYMQSFNIPINKFDGDVEVAVDDKELSPGAEFLVSPGCPSVHGTYKILKVDSETIDNAGKFAGLASKKHRHKYFLLDLSKLKNILEKKRLQWILGNGMKVKGLVFIEDKLMWSAETSVDPFPKVYIKKGTISEFSKEIAINVESDFVNGYGVKNVCGYIKGFEKPDSYIVFTAHYDHLGKMGREAVFPGANDNAGGVAMLLDLAQYYQTHKPSCSVVFLFFAGEEAGLLGSIYFTEHPIFPLSSIKFLLNLDLVTTGEKGMTIVNATSHPKYFDTIVYINKVMDYLPAIAPRTNAPNSDHYPFTLKNVPAFFFYLQGDYPWYHDVFDTYERIKLDKYDNAFKLIRQFSDVMMK